MATNDGVHYRPQTKFAKVMFLQVSVCPHGGACVVAAGGCGVCVVAARGEGACMVAARGRAWFLQGGMRGCSGGACMGYDEIWRYNQ